MGSLSTIRHANLSGDFYSVSFTDGQVLDRRFVSSSAALDVCRVAGVDDFSDLAGQKVEVVTREDRIVALRSPDGHRQLDCS